MIGNGESPKAIGAWASLTQGCWDPNKEPHHDGKYPPPRPHWMMSSQHFLLVLMSSCRRAFVPCVRKLILPVGILALAMTASFAHSPVDGTTPEDGAVLSETPSHIVLSFERQVRLTRVWVAHAGSSKVDLDLEGQKTFASRFEVPLKDMGSGMYRIEWRGLARDGHVMRDKFTFQIE